MNALDQEHLVHMTELSEAERRQEKLALKLAFFLMHITQEMEKWFSKDDLIDLYTMINNT